MYDIFFSYSHKDKGEVMPICSALSAELEVWIDETKSEDGKSITGSVVEGLAQSKVLLAYYSPNYSRSRACQWELTAAFLAAQQEGKGRPERRIRIIKPKEVHVEIHPAELHDALYRQVSVPASPDEIREIVGSVRAHVEGVTGVFGEIRALTPPAWYGRRGVGYLRFVGRLFYLWQIHSALFASEYSVITGAPAASSVDYVHGMGGVGKSLLAEEYARRYGAAFPGGVFWLSAFGNDDSMTGIGADEREAAREGQIRQIASALKIPVDGRSPDEIEGSLLWELGARGEPFLWVVDDLPSGMDEGTVQRWLSPHPLGKTLITTRSQEYGSLGSQVRLDVLSPDEAYELLTSRREPVEAEEQVFARGIVKDLGYHALAVDVAGAAIRASSVVLPFADFEEELASSASDDDVLEFAGELAGTLPHGHEASIASTFLKSIDRLESEEGLDFLRLASRLAVAPIPATLISSVFCEVDSLDERSGRRRADLAVNRAERLSLAERAYGDAGAWSVHTLISRTMRFRDPKPDRSEELRDAAVEVLTTAFRENAKDPRDHAALEPVVAHARELADRADDLETAYLAGWVEDPETVLLMAKTAVLIGWVAQYDDVRGAYKSAEKLLRRECEITRRILRVEHPSTLKTMSNLALTLQHQGDLDGARKIQEQVLEITRRLLREEHPLTLASMSNLALTLQHQGDLDGALKIQEQVLEITRRLLIEEHPDTLKTMNNLAVTLQHQGELERALKIQEGVLETRRRILGPEHPDTLTSMNNLASMLSDQGELERALKIQEEVLEITRRILGSEHPSTITSMSDLAETIKAQGDLERAQKIQEQVLEISRRVLGEEHPSTTTEMNNLAVTLSNQGELERALKIQEEVLEITRRILGSEHPSTITSMSDLAETIKAQGDLERAQKIQEQVLEITRRILGPEHPDTLTSMGNLATTLSYQGDLAGAREIQEEVLEITRRILGSEHPDTLTSMGNLAVTLKAHGDLNGARNIQEEVLEISRRVLGGEHPSTLISMNNLAGTLSDQGDLAGARAIQEDVLEMHRRVLGSEHSNTLVSAWNLLATLNKIDDPARARTILETDLLWLLDRDPASLGADQRRIREWIEEVMR